ncbi:MAG: zinc ribbon domain-containing protein [Gammaproteobacteria bacterium]|nr:zinc ribbon domain-containing protein [Gammaproteobacteria bacterium]
MPIYEYQCNSCGHKLEALQKISDKPLKDCPKCEKAELNKLISAASFRLKGGGWYKTDFKTGNKKQLAESDSASNSSAKDSGSKPSKDKPKSNTDSKSKTSPEKSTAGK